VAGAGSAQGAGVSADHSITAVNSMKIHLTQLEQQLTLASVGDRWNIHAFRRDELMEFELILEAARSDTVELLADKPDRHRQAWLSGKVDE